MTVYSSCVLGVQWVFILCTGVVVTMYHSILDVHWSCSDYVLSLCTGDAVTIL